MHMMESGIEVEPLVQKEWCALLQHPTDQVLNPILIWTEKKMEEYVRQSQHYINFCRKCLGVPTSQWSSPFHELLKSTVVTSATSHRGFTSILKWINAQSAAESRLNCVRMSSSFDNLSGGSHKEEVVEMCNTDESPAYQAMLYTLLSPSTNPTISPQLYSFGMSSSQKIQSSPQKQKYRARSMSSGSRKGQRGKSAGHFTMMTNSIEIDCVSPPSISYAKNAPPQS